MTNEEYKGHRAGSNKGIVHKVFDEKGKDAALKKAGALGLLPNTARTWCSEWGGGAEAKGKKATKPEAKGKKVTKPAAKKAVKGASKKVTRVKVASKVKRPPAKKATSTQESASA